jgi:hypothetical protein
VVRMGAEDRLKARGVVLEEIDFGREDEPNVSGCLVAQYVEQGVRLKVAVRPGLSGHWREGFAEWAESRLQRFLDHGPEPDGWQKRSDGAWQLWGRWTQMPSLD